MCRLFGLSSGTHPVHATFWLVDAPDSLEVESRRNVDGSGIGYFRADGSPVMDKQPEAAYRDADFVREALEVKACTFVAHVRWASTGVVSLENTHPFSMHGRLMAHNGGLGDLPTLEAQLGDYRDLVKGDTDSERYFAFITQQIDQHGGDVGAGITAAASWIAGHLPVSSLNTVVITANEMWALRYPETHALHIIERPAGASAASASAGPSAAGMHVRSATSSVHSDDLHTQDSVVIASEELDGESGWRMLDVGELVHVSADLTVTSTIAIPNAPAHLVPLPAANPNIDT
jgi:predicted glutamine amidotransferase